MRIKGCYVGENQERWCRFGCDPRPGNSAYRGAVKYIENVSGTREVKEGCTCEKEKMVDTGCGSRVIGIFVCHRFWHLLPEFLCGYLRKDGKRGKYGGV